MLDINVISDVHYDFFQLCTSLTSINFNVNQLTKIPNLWDVRFTLLKIHFYNNKITSVKADEINFLETLQEINLSANPLTVIPAITELHPNLGKLRIAHCPDLPCDLSLFKWINAVRKSQVIRVYTSSSFGDCFQNSTVADQFSSGAAMEFDNLDYGLTRGCLTFD